MTVATDTLLADSRWDRIRTAIGWTEAADEVLVTEKATATGGLHRDAVADHAS